MSDTCWVIVSWERVVAGCLRYGGYSSWLLLPSVDVASLGKPCKTEACAGLRAERSRKAQLTYLCDLLIPPYLASRTQYSRIDPITSRFHIDSSLHVQLLHPVPNPGRLASLPNSNRVFPQEIENFPALSVTVPGMISTPPTLEENLYKIRLCYRKLLNPRTRIFWAKSLPYAQATPLVPRGARRKEEP